MSKFLDWLFDRKRTCADCSLYERQVECLHDGIMEERRAKWAAQEGAERAESLQAECDGLMRELWLERRRVDELKQRLALTDANVRCCFAAMALQAGNAHAEIARLWKEMNEAQRAHRDELERLQRELEAERQRRIEAQAELEALKGKGATP